MNEQQSHEQQSHQEQGADETRPSRKDTLFRLFLFFVLLYAIVMTPGILRKLMETPFPS